MTVKEALKYAENLLADITDEAKNEAEILVSFITEIPESRLYFTDKTVDEKTLSDILNERKRGTPIQYIIGKWWFYKGEFFVGEGVLIPRQDTETLVETAAELIKNEAEPSVCDLCAGSGCIGISIAADFPRASVVCVEKYEKALEYLKKNIIHNKTENVRAVLSDVLKSPFGEYDLIVSNPPYITKEDMRTLSKEVKREPETALFGGDDGLDFYRKITEIWKPSLKKNGMLAFEVGYDQAEKVCEILRKNGFSNISVKNDLCGVQRVVFGTVCNI